MKCILLLMIVFLRWSSHTCLEILSSFVVHSFVGRQHISVIILPVSTSYNITYYPIVVWKLSYYFKIIPEWMYFSLHTRDYNMFASPFVDAIYVRDIIAWLEDTSKLLIFKRRRAAATWQQTSFMVVFISLCIYSATCYNKDHSIIVHIFRRTIDHIRVRVCVR